MAFAIQYINRPGTGYGGYVVNDGTNTVFVKATTPNDTRRLYVWLGNGNDIEGKRIANSSEALTLPNVMLNPAQYNVMVGSMPTHDVKAFTVKGNA